MYKERHLYDSKTGLGKKFAEKVSERVQPITAPIPSPCIWVTRNVGLGMVPGSTKKFLKEYSKHVIGVIVNGDRRFGRYYCTAGPKIEKAFNVPILLNIERDGNDADVEALKAIIAKKEYE